MGVKEAQDITTRTRESQNEMGVGGGVESRAGKIIVTHLLDSKMQAHSVSQTCLSSLK